MWWRPTVRYLCTSITFKSIQMLWHSSLDVFLEKGHSRAEIYEFHIRKGIIPKHQHRTFQGLWDGWGLLGKKAAVHGEGQARRYSTQKFLSNKNKHEKTPRLLFFCFKSTTHHNINKKKWSQQTNNCLCKMVVRCQISLWHTGYTGFTGYAVTLWLSSRISILKSRCKKFPKNLKSRRKKIFYNINYNYETFFFVLVAKMSIILLVGTEVTKTPKKTKTNKPQASGPVWQK